MEYIKIMLVVGAVLPLQGMQRFAPSVRLAAAAYKSQFQPKMRGLNDFSQIKGAYLLGVRTPLIGHLADTEIKSHHSAFVYPCMLGQELSVDKPPSHLKAFLELFFYKNPIDQTVSVTKYDKSMVTALPPCGIAYLLDTYSLQIDKKNDDTFVEEWYQKYTTLQDQIHTPFSKGSFIKKARQFLKNFRTMAQAVKPEQVSCILLSVLFKNTRDKKDLQAFATQYNVILPEENYTESDFLDFEKKFQEKFVDNLSSAQVEQFSYWIWKKQQRGQKVAYDSQLLKTPSVPCGYRGQPVRALCAEEAIRTLLNTLLCNPKTQQLEISLLPEKVQLGCTEELLRFVEKYKTLTKDSEQEKQSAQDFLDLVSDKPGIFYHQGKNYELYGTADNTLNLLKFLFGVPAVSSYKELGEVLSTDTRTIIFTKEGVDGKVVFAIYKKDDTNAQTELTLKFDRGHISSTFSSDTNFSWQALASIETFFTLINNGSLSFSPFAFSFDDFNALSPTTFKEVIVKKDFLIDPFFIRKMTYLLSNGNKLDRETILEILIDNYDVLDHHLLDQEYSRGFLLYCFNKVTNQNLSLKIAQKLVNRGHCFSVSEIEYSIIAKNRHEVLSFYLEHANTRSHAIDYVDIILRYDAGECLQALINEGFAVDKVSLFYYLLSIERPSCLASLIKSEPGLLKTKEPGTSTMGLSPLFYVIDQAYFARDREYFRTGKTLKILIDAGADIYEINEVGQTALAVMKKGTYDQSFIGYLRSKEDILKTFKVAVNRAVGTFKDVVAKI